MKIQKKSIEDFIKRYDLNGLVANAIWELKDDNIEVAMKSIDNNMLGFLNFKENPFNHKGDIGIMNVNQLRSIISVMDEEIDLEVNENMMQLEIRDDSGLESLFILSPLELMGNKPSLKKEPDYEFELKLDKATIDKISKAIKAFGSNADKFTIVSEDGEDKFVVGYSQNKTNRISLGLGKLSNTTYNPVHFKSETLMNIISANSDTEITMSFSQVGMLKLECNSDTYNNVYRIAKFGV